MPGKAAGGVGVAVKPSPRSPGDPTPPAFSRVAWPLVMAAGGGVLTNLAFPDRGWWPLAYLGVALLLLALGRARMAQAGATGLVWGVAFFLPHVYWVIHATGSSCRGSR